MALPGTLEVLGKLNAALTDLESAIGDLQTTSEEPSTESVGLELSPDDPALVMLLGDPPGSAFPLARALCTANASEYSEVMLALAYTALTLAHSDLRLRGLTVTEDHRASQLLARVRDIVETPAAKPRIDVEASRRFIAQAMKNKK